MMVSQTAGSSASRCAAAALMTMALAGCGHSDGAPKGPETASPAAPISRLADESMIRVAAGSYQRGSTPEERERAYLDYEYTAGHAAARRGKWFEREAPSGRVYLDAIVIDRTPVTNAAYSEFVRATGHRAPTMDRDTWKRQGFIQDYDKEVERFEWTGGEPALDRVEHPVVLVSWDDALAYCKWRGALVGRERRLPSAPEFEKTARGLRGSVYPWGAEFDASRLNSAVAGPRDTTPVGAFPRGASPLGLVDVAGNVFHWTRTPWPGKGDRYTVKGSAWDDYGGLGRGAARHGRPRTIRHAIVGFRCAGPG